MSTTTISPLSDEYLTEFFQGYLEALVWSTIDLTTGEHFDDLNADCITSEARETLAYEALDFAIGSAADLLLIQEIEPGGPDWTAAARAGHDFALTRAHHGAGYWDRGYGAPGDRLTTAAHVYGEVNLASTVAGKIEVA
jgi:hypothetical protein